MRQFNPGYRFLYPPIYATNHSPRVHRSRPVNPSASKKHVSTRRSTPPERRRVFGSPGRHNRARGSDGECVSDTLVSFLDAHSAGIWPQAWVLTEVFLTERLPRCQELRRWFIRTITATVENRRAHGHAARASAASPATAVGG